MKPHAAAALAGAAALLSGCVAAAVPLAAGGILARNQAARRDTAPAAAANGGLKTDRARAAMRELEGRTPSPVAGQLPPPVAGAAVPVPGRTAGSPVPTTLTELPPPSGPAAASSGTGEGAAASIQGYQALWNHVRGRLAARAQGKPLESVVLAPGARLDDPRFEPCGARPPAVLVDLDEAALKGSMALGSDPQGRWRRWNGDGSDALAVAPGAAETLAALRREGVEVIFVSYRAEATAPAVAAVLDRFGLGPVAPGRTLLLRGREGATLPAAQLRRSAAQSHCVIAMVGDELSDFSDLFGDSAVGSAESRTAAAETMVAPLWGSGWFMLPAPLHSIASASATPLAPQPSGVK